MGIRERLPFRAAPALLARTLAAALSSGLAALSGLAPPLAAQTDPAPAPASAASAPTQGVEITYLANAGFYIEAGDKAVLIDACVGEPAGPCAFLPGPVLSKLVNFREPFAKPMLVLVSHEHLDHMQPRVLENLLHDNPGAHLVTSQPVIDALEAGAVDFQLIQQKVVPVKVVPGAFKTMTEDGIQVDFFPLEPGGKGHEGLHNLGHLIEIGGVRILHVGDAEATPANFAAYGLPARQIDLAIVPYWYFGSAAGAQVLREQIHARTVIACHVPAREKDWKRISESLKAQFPDVIVFQAPMEKRSFAPAGAPPAANGESKGSGG